MENEKYEIVKFVNGELEIDVNININQKTVWLNKEQISLLFDRDRTVISRHINNILKEELDKNSVSAKFAHTANDGKIYEVDYYNLENEKYEIVKFVDNEFELDVNVSPREETIWLTQEQIALLFNINFPAVSKHINNILGSRELDGSTISILETVRKEGERFVKRKIKIFNLEMIIK